ncbi:MAG: hypothetical protein ABIN94_16785 [Ferruginibacter sp.]
MIPNQKSKSPFGIILLALVLINAIILEDSFTVNEQWYWALIVTIPLLILTGVYIKKSKKAKDRRLQDPGNTKL